MIWPIEVFISNPFDLVIGSLRTFNLNYTVTDATILKHRVWNYFNNVLTGLEQTMGKFQMFPVGCFYQNPSFHEYWINSSTTQKIRFLK
jgi:hypothetical protein